MSSSTSRLVVSLLAAATALVLGIAALSLPASAQIAGSVAGVVRGPDGAPLAGARVVASGASLQVGSRESVTGADGRYRLAPLPAGEYTIEVALEGFQSRRLDAVDVGVNAEITRDFALELATVEESVIVVSDVPAIEVTRSEVGARIPSEAIENLPLNGRNVEDLVNLVPGVRPRPASEGDQQFSIFGERPAATSFVVDGGDNNDPVDGGAFQRYAQDSIQEFEVITTGYEAEFGRAQGGVVNVITRSGTNGLKGTAFYFRRDDSWDSSNVSGQDAPQLERDQFGLSLGGPIVRDRAFYFASAEALDEQRGRNIDFSQLPSWVAAGVATVGGVEDFAAGPEDEGFTALGKVDWVPSDRSRWTFSYNHTDDQASGEIPTGIAGALVLPSAARTSDRESDGFTLRNTWIAGNDGLLESTVRYLDASNGTNLDKTQRAEAILLLFRSGFIQTGAQLPGGRSERNVERLQVAQTYTWLLGGAGGDDHQFKLGYELVDTRLDGFDEVSNDVEYSAFFLAPNAVELNRDLFERLGFQHSAARFLFLSANEDGTLDLDLDNEDLGVFAQDEWRISPNVTLDLGLRWDRSSLFGDDDDNFAPRLGLAWDVGGRHTTVVKANAGVFYDRNALSAAATVPEKGGIFTRNAFDVALPRLGFRYTDSLIDLVITSGFPTGGGGRTPAENPLYRQFAADLRANPLALYTLFGIAVADPNAPPVVTADNIEQLSGLTPEQAIALLESTYPGTDWTFFDLPGGSVLGDRVLSFLPRGPLDLSRNLSVYDRDRTPRTEAFTLGVEHQFGDGYVVSATLVHRETDDLLTRRITNLFDVPPGDPNFGRTVDGGQRLNTVTYEGFIDYDGVVVAIRRPLRDRFGFQASYTYSESEDNLLTGNVGSTFSDNNDPSADVGEANLSVPNLFVGSVTSVLPLDFRVSAIAFYRDGSAFSPRGIIDSDGDGLVDQRDLSFPRNSFRVDDYFTLDLRVEKPFELPNGDEIALLVDVFNVTNEDNVANVNSVSGPDFGVPNDFFPGREVQVGVRYFLGGR